jgi:hypothetical protein
MKFSICYKTFEGGRREANPITGEETTAPNGFSLLQRDFDQEKFLA